MLFVLRFVVKLSWEGPRRGVNLPFCLSSVPTASASCLVRGAVIPIPFCGAMLHNSSSPTRIHASPATSPDLHSTLEPLPLTPRPHLPSACLGITSRPQPRPSATITGQGRDGARRGRGAHPRLPLPLLSPLPPVPVVAVIPVGREVLLDLPVGLPQPLAEALQLSAERAAEGGQIRLHAASGAALRHGAAPPPLTAGPLQHRGQDRGEAAGGRPPAGDGLPQHRLPLPWEVGGLYLPARPARCTYTQRYLNKSLRFLKASPNAPVTNTESCHELSCCRLWHTHSKCNHPASHPALHFPESI